MLEDIDELIHIIDELIVERIEQRERSKECYYGATTINIDWEKERLRKVLLRIFGVE